MLSSDIEILCRKDEVILQVNTLLCNMCLSSMDWLEQHCNVCDGPSSLEVSENTSNLQRDQHPSAEVWQPAPHTRDHLQVYP